MKKRIAFLTLASVLLFSACGLFNQAEAEDGFFDSSYLAQCRLTGMPTPDTADMRHDEDTVYCNMTDEERMEYADKVAAYLMAKDDIYYQGYHYETGCVGGIFFLPEYRFAPLTEAVDYGGWFAFSLTENLNEGNEFNYSYWNGVTVRVSLNEGKVGSYSYNTVIKIDNDPNGIVYQVPDHEHIDTNENGVCDVCNRQEEYIFRLNYDKTGYILSDIGPGYVGGDVVIPSTYGGLPVVEIEMYAFGNCNDNLTSVTIPGSVKEIGMKAFAKQDDLETVIINGSTVIDVQAFYLCPKLKTVVIGEGTQYIYAGAFEDCDSLESVTIAGSVKEILSCAFCYCPNLKTITIPASVEEIGWACFVGSGLTDIYFEMSAPGEAWDEEWDYGLYIDEEIGQETNVNLHWAEVREG